MFILVLLCLILGLSGFYFALKKQHLLVIFLSFTLCLFSSFLFSFYVHERISKGLNGFKNIVYNKFFTIENTNEQKLTSTLSQYDTNLLNLSERVQKLEWENTDMGQEQKRIQEFNATEPNLCKQLPMPSEIGGDLYPVNPKYGAIGFLGELFTAVPCGEERVKKIMGVDGDKYTLGAYIILKNPPTQELLQTLLSLGFHCETSGIETKECKNWKLDKTVLLKEILKLEPFYKEFENDDCVNCG